jgi:hypothetical protein
MSIELNPIAQAELELAEVLRRAGAAAGADLHAFKTEIMGIVDRAIIAEKLMMGQHEQCGEDNPDGIVAKCACACHKGHYRHSWVPMFKEVKLNPDSTYHMLFRCRFCPDIRLQVIKTEWVKEKYDLVALEYTIRGSQKVLSKETWLSSTPVPADLGKARECKL